MKSFCLASLLALTLFTGSVLAADPAAGKMRVKEVAARTFFCTKKELKIEQEPEFIRASIRPLMEASTDLKLGYVGAPTLSYIGYRGEREKSFTAELGVPVRKKSDEKKGGFYFREAPKFKCASIIIQGRVDKVGESWMALVQQATDSGHIPSGESREVYLAWEGEESENNIIELQLGLQ